MLRRRGAVDLRGVLVGFTGAVTGEHGGLLVGGRSAPVRLAGTEVSCRGVPMRPFGSLHGLQGVRSCTLRGLGVRWQTGCQLRPALLQLASASTRRLAARSRGVPTRRAPLGHSHQLSFADSTSWRATIASAVFELWDSRLSSSNACTASILNLSMIMPLA